MDYRIAAGRERALAMRAALCQYRGSIRGTSAHSVEAAGARRIAAMACSRLASRIKDMFIQGDHHACHCWDSTVLPPLANAMLALISNLLITGFQSSNWSLSGKPEDLPLSNRRWRSGQIARSHILPNSFFPLTILQNRPDRNRRFDRTFYWSSLVAVICKLVSLRRISPRPLPAKKQVKPVARAGFCANRILRHIEAIRERAVDIYRRLQNLVCGAYEVRPIPRLEAYGRMLVASI